MGSWKLVVRNGQHLLNTIWVLKRKNAETDTPIAKARLVIDGSRQRSSEYDKIFASTPYRESVKIFQAACTDKRMFMSKGDVKGAYHNSKCDKDIFVKPPLGMELPPEDKDKVLKLVNGVYGIRQGAKLWEDTRNKLLAEYGFTECPSAACLFKRTASDGSMQLIIWHSDDASLGCENEEEEAKFWKWLNQRAKTIWKKGVGEWAGINMEFHDGYSTMDQIPYIQAIIDEFLEVKRNPDGQFVRRSTPWSKRLEEKFDTEDLTPIKDEPRLKGFLRLLGLLRFSVLTRLEIEFALNRLSSYADRPRMVHWEAAQHLLAYLQGSLDTKLYFKAGTEMHMELFVDANLAANPITRKSITGIILRIGSTAVASVSKNQAIVTDSTVASETLALAEGAKLAEWGRGIMEWLGYGQLTATTIWCDNQGAINNTEEGAERSKTKHLDIKYMFLRDMTKRGIIRVRKIHTSRNISDANTKGVGRLKNIEFRKGMGLFREVDEFEGYEGYSLEGSVNMVSWKMSSGV